MDWITDRPPTEADGDEDGYVIVSTATQSLWYRKYFKLVSCGQPWLPFTPPGATPEPAAAAVTTPTSQPRRIVSIALDADSVAAVADDGTAWWLSGDGTKWTQLPALPDREVG